MTKFKGSYVALVTPSRRARSILTLFKDLSNGTLPAALMDLFPVVQRVKHLPFLMPNIDA